MKYVVIIIYIDTDETHVLTIWASHS